MSGTQPQLLNIALNPSDVVYTPDWVARDMVEYFQPNGRILEPCAGDGVFLKYLPAGTEWCEIEKGRDFFQWQEPVDWIVGNPPYSTSYEWFNHSFSLSDNIVYLIPLHKCFTSDRAIRTIRAYGGIKEVMYYGKGREIQFDFGTAMGAVHFQRGYHGGMTMSYYEEAAK
jgi:hypothetical protein